MGCGSSAPSSVIEGDGGSNGKLPSKEGEARGVRPTPMGAADDEEIPTEVLPESPRAPVKPPLAFEIPLEENENEGTQGLVKKYPPRPPRRLQRLNTIDPAPPSLQDLQEKLESAEKRRQTILQNRIASANKASRQMTKTFGPKDEDLSQIDDILRSPSKDFIEMKNAINTEEHGVQS